MTTRIPLRLLSASPIPRILQRDAQRCLNSFETKIPLCRQQRALQLYRHYSSSQPQPPGDIPPTDLRSQLNRDPIVIDSTQPPKPKRSLRSYIYATFFLLVGLTAGQYVRLLIAPPPLPEPGTKEDVLMVKFLHKEAEKIPLVQSLSNDPNWKHYDAYSGFPAEAREHRLATGPLGGSRGLGGFQRIFYNDETGECISVVWFGGALAGWPGVTHGGVIATVLDESLGRCAARLLPEKSCVTANLELNYLKPVVTNSFYITRTIPQKDGSKSGKQWVSGSLETLEGRICVEAKGLFAVPKKYNTKPIVPV